jgi:hypothetical protein
MSTYPKLCGKCLHSVESHIAHNGHFMYCASCGKLCDNDEFAIQYKPSGTVVQDGIVYRCSQ